MTCVLNPTSISSITSSLPSMRWSPMTSTADVSTLSAIGLPSHSSSYGDSPNDSVTYRKSNSNKKRASRAGTRSVSTLSAAQLERKRANDREAQRAIRQRTKDHIDGLEKQLNDVKEALETREKLLTAAHSRNRELEDEIAVLRIRLNDANISTNMPTKFVRPADNNNIASTPASAVSEASGSISQRSNSISHGFPLNHGAMTGTMINSWQQQQPGFTPSNGPMMVTNNSNDAPSRSMTGWRARDSPQSMSATVNTTQNLHPPQTIPYASASNNEERSAWPTQYEFGVSAQQTPRHFTQAGAQRSDDHFAQAQSIAYQGTPQQPQTGFHPPLLPPQNDFSQAFYQFASQAQSYPNQAQYRQQTSNQTVNGNFPPTQVQPSPTTQYAADNAYNQQQIHPPMQFRDEAEYRGYTMGQFPSG